LFNIAWNKTEQSGKMETMIIRYSGISVISKPIRRLNLHIKP
jgi:hypothetical protein